MKILQKYALFYCWIQSRAYGAHHRAVEANEPDAASSGHESHKDHKSIKSSE